LAAKSSIENGGSSAWYNQTLRKSVFSDRWNTICKSSTTQTTSSCRMWT